MIKKGAIRRSTNEDLQSIHAWLVDQDARGVEGSFLCNWELTKEQHDDGELLVYVDGKSGSAVAYQWGSLIYPGILEVRHDMRHKGIGRLLVERRIAEACEGDECFLFIQCEPSSSATFWERMGFTAFNLPNGDLRAYRTLGKTHKIPTESKAVNVLIRFYPEAKKWDENTSALSVATPSAFQTLDGVIHLGKRVLFFTELHPHCGDIVVEIEVAGQSLYCDKAKYPKSRSIGVKRCTHGFFIDQIFRP
jgi:GNAT superfamily N-acetyltransferase